MPFFFSVCPWISLIHLMWMSFPLLSDISWLVYLLSMFHAHTISALSNILTHFFSQQCTTLYRYIFHFARSYIWTFSAGSTWELKQWCAEVFGCSYNCLSRQFLLDAHLIYRWQVPWPYPFFVSYWTCINLKKWLP